MSIQQKKYKRLRKELQFVHSELEYVEEVLREAHIEFQEYYIKFCENKDIDIAALNKEHSEKIEQLIPKPVKKETGLVKYENKTEKNSFKKIYKKIARKLHPDLGGDERDFKEATSAMQEKNFEKILDICDRHDILIEIDNEVLELLQEQISQVKKRIDKEKTTYSWKFYSCAKNNSCKNILIQQFLKQLFNYGGE
jgi:hypothetical protein